MGAAVIVLVCGGRDYADAETVNRTLDQIDIERGPIRGLIHGAARGADTLAAEWQRARIKAAGNRHHLWIAGHPANWGRDGKAAGPIRNQHMLDTYGAAIAMVVAFPGGRGTADMVQRAERAGIPVVRPTIDAPPPLR